MITSHQISATVVTLNRSYYDLTYGHQSKPYHEINLRDIAEIIKYRIINRDTKVISSHKYGRVPAYLTICKSFVIRCYIFFYFYMTDMVQKGKGEGVEK